MRSVRWRKALRDLGSHPIRSLLVVLSIAVGVFAIGTIAGADAMLQRMSLHRFANPARFLRIARWLTPAELAG